MISLGMNSLLIADSSTWGIPALYTVGGAVGVLVVAAVVYQLLRLVLPKLSAIALATFKETISQPLFYVLLAIGVVALLMFPYIPFNTFGEDIKLLKSSGVKLITVLGIMLGLWTASNSVSEEIEGRTALTLLSKPINRRQFVAGKFLGIVAPIGLMFVLLGTLFLATISFKAVYEAKENALPRPTTAQCAIEVLHVVPGLALSLMEAVMLTAISVAISTRLPMLANLTICAAIYVLGHIVPALVNSSVGRFEIVAFFGRLFGIVLPVLDHFDVEGSVATGVMISPSYLGWALLYCTLYSAAALLIALILFEDRDLA